MYDSTIARLSIDASALAYARRTGIGRVLESLIPELIEFAAGRVRIRLFAGGAINIRGMESQVREGRLELEEARSPSLYLWQQLGMGRAIRRFNPAVHLAPEGLAPIGLRTPSVGIVHDLLWRRHPETCKPHVRLVNRLRFRASLAGASAVLCDSDFTRGELETLFPGCGPAQPRVAHLGVCMRQFRPAGESDRGEIGRFRERHGLDRPYLLAVGNIRPHKNLNLVTAALRELQTAGEALPQFALVGAPSAGVDHRLDEAGLPPDIIRRIGYADDEEVALAYRGALALVFPSRYEGFGLPLLEAMASGVPVLHARSGALPEVAGDAGLGFDADDAGQLATAIARVQTEGGLAGELRARGLRRAAAFPWRRTAEIVWEEIERLLFQGANGNAAGGQRP